MADMGWTARVAAAAAASAGTGAAQLGLGYGLGVVVWPLSDTPDNSVWLGSLAWATWITASATVLGAVIASRLGGGPKPRPGAPLRLNGPWRLALAAAAAIGALVAVALIALPARSAVRADIFSPQVIAARYALLGVLLGLIVAYWAVVSRPVAANLITTGLWLWALAISAVVVDLTLHRSSATYLTSWQFAVGSGHLYGTILWPSAALTLAVAFVIGVVSVAPAARRGHLGLGAATSGAVGPLLVAAAFFVLAPQLTGTLGPLESAYLIAPYAVIAGLAGSALTVSFSQAVQTRRATRTVPGRRALPAAPAPADTDRDETPTLADPAPSRTRPGRQRTAEPPADDQPSTDGRRGWRKGQQDPEAPASDDHRASSTGVATVPAADPATFPPAPAKQKTRLSRLFSRTKVPAQPNADAAPGASEVPPESDSTASSKPSATGPKPPSGSAKSPTEASTSSGTAPKPTTGPSSAARPSPRPSASSSTPSEASPTGRSTPPKPPAGAPSTPPTPTTGRPSTPPTPTTGRPSTPPTPTTGRPPTPSKSTAGGSAPAPAKPSAAAASGTPRQTGPGRGENIGNRPVSADPDRAGREPSDGADPEIAAAARPRGRSKKAPEPVRKGPENDKSPQSTVTPPPSSPTIAQINPKPPTD